MVSELSGKRRTQKLIPLRLSSYAFKVTVAARDTPLAYLSVDPLKHRVAPADEPAAVA